jgi:hypothetical protein
VPQASDGECKECVQLVCMFPSTECGGYKRHTRGERQNTFVCAFDPQSPRISAFDIHEWIHNTLCLRESEVVMIQIDSPK